MHSKEHMKNLSKLASMVNTKHGMSHTRIYGIWRGLRKRCDNSKNSAYKYYGGRGIGYDPRWRNFECFYADMKAGYKENLTIERINSKGNYTKKNCRWVTQAEQTRNTSRNIWLDYRGKKYLAIDLSRKAGLTHNAFLVRIRNGMNVEQAMKKVVTRKDAKLKDSDIPKIKKLLSEGHTQSGIARFFHVSQAIIWSIKMGKTYKHI